MCGNRLSRFCYNGGNRSRCAGTAVRLPDKRRNRDGQNMMSNEYVRKIVCCLLTGILMLGLCGCKAEPASDPQPEAEPEVTVIPEEPDPAEDAAGIEERVLRSTVNIVTGKGDFGAGFAVENGYVVTNYHVLYGSPEDITVITYDRDEFQGVLLGYDAEADIAVLEIGTDLEPSVLGDSDAVIAGQTVTAVGNPYGDLSFARAPGKILDVDAELLDLIDRERRFLHYDGDAVSGFSGGPVYDAQGAVIGVLNSRYAGDLSAYDFDCLCGIIPINTVKESVAKILDQENVQ